MILYYLIGAFKIWMLIDAARRRIDYYWYIIILMPLGAVIYFFAVKIHDYNLAGVKKAFARPASVDDLKRVAEETPSLANKIAYGQALYDNKQFAEAEKVFDDVLERDDSDKEALYGLALSRINLDRSQDALDFLHRLIEEDAAFHDYEPWFDLAFAHWKLNERERAVEVLEQLVGHAPRIKHKAILGKYLARAGRKDAARTMLESAMHDYETATAFVKRHSGRWLSEIRGTLKELS